MGGGGGGMGVGWGFAHTNITAGLGDQWGEEIHVFLFVYRFSCYGAAELELKNGLSVLLC